MGAAVGGVAGVGGVLRGISAPNAALSESAGKPARSDSDLEAFLPHHQATAMGLSLGRQQCTSETLGIGPSAVQYLYAARFPTPEGRRYLVSSTV